MHQVNTEQPRRSQRWRRVRRWLLGLPLLFMIATTLQVLVLRFIDPPFSAFMFARQLHAVQEGDWHFRVAYDWRDFDDISEHLPVAQRTDPTR